jgi:hypothetical protein
MMPASCSPQREASAVQQVLTFFVSLFVIKCCISVDGTDKFCAAQMQAMLSKRITKITAQFRVARFLIPNSSIAFLSFTERLQQRHVLVHPLHFAVKLKMLLELRMLLLDFLAQRGQDSTIEGFQQPVDVLHVQGICQKKAFRQEDFWLPLSCEPYFGSASKRLTLTSLRTSLCSSMNSSVLFFNRSMTLRLHMPYRKAIVKDRPYMTWTLLKRLS